MYGRIYTVSAAVHLTQLSCSHCTLSVDSSQGSFVDRLIQLWVVHSKITDLYDLGICVCLALQGLINCLITASEFQDSLDTRRSDYVLSIPAGMSSLTNLTDLCIAVPSVAGKKANLAWLYGLVTLERLQFMSVAA
ncbi:TPA: hypothetical protein ACH3X1_015841 [Trebouxia sp. C0004]